MMISFWYAACYKCTFFISDLNDDVEAREMANIHQKETGHETYISETEEDIDD